MADSEPMVCPGCGTSGAPIKRTRGSFWRRSANVDVCQTCGAALVPISSPVGQPSAHPAPVETTPPAPDPVKELERLERMRDRGQLSRDEFDQEKRKLLGAQSYRRI